jgi:hypothetical protein
VLLAAARRLVILLAGTSAITLVAALLGALLFGAGLFRAISVAFYLVGSFLLVAGFFVGNRGPARPREGAEGGSAVAGMFGIGLATRGVRWATTEEREETIASSALFVTLGFLLIVIGFVTDDSVRLH